MSENQTSELGLQQEPIPERLLFRLPDDTPIISSEYPGTPGVHIELGNRHICTLAPLERTLSVSPHGIVNKDRAQSSPVLRLRLAEGVTSMTNDDLWAVIYGLWTRRPHDDLIPLEIPDEGIENATDLQSYLVQTGLAFPAPDGNDSSDLLLVRASFWQGAGASIERHWLRAPVAHPSLSPLFPFPFFESFTRTEHVLTTHPRRPPKPAPGSVFYARFICSIGQTLRFIHIDASNPKHFETYQRWQNSERVNEGWRERGPEEKHRKYLADRLADPHSMGFLFEWDGEFAGYGELSWVKEDPMGTYVGGLGDYDQGTHILIGEDKFRGRRRFTAVSTSMKHACFLRDPRTEVVVGDPRADLAIVYMLKNFLPQEFNREFEFPHKRAVYFVLRRQRFFQAATLY